ncbi:ATP-dependent helicase [Hazenella coriacea]|uniref:DNA 3'-5' helicase n=1 Tax=Hazenella coriacea TaxID=1179467 RepID=A0A4R3L7G9_9BACL|nr:ATP-dependent helicase [Hazenella coriacea]TCS93436.1 DNA helicase-2/ATP-dependent DNA helicase PcrA [Hazenella coriacea]
MLVQSEAIDLLLTDLNKEQRKAVTAGDSPVVVFAGPGSGKTTVLTRRVLYLLHQGIPANQIMVVTFTRAAAQEMKNRLMTIMPESRSKLMIGTFHSIFLTMLRESGERIPPLIQAKEQNEWVRQLLIEQEQPADDEAVSSALNQMGLCKGNLITPTRMNVKKKKNILFRDLYQAYETKKEEVGVWDFDDILLATYGCCLNLDWLSYWQNRFQAILVDEFQDINRVQYEILLQLSKQRQRLFVVGDDDQSIYGFRGSDPSFMLQLHKDFPSLQRIVLSVNYRSTDTIIQVGDQLIKQNHHRQSKPRAGTGAQGPALIWMEPEDEEEEAEQIVKQLGDQMQTAILYRTSTQARAMIDALVRNDISFTASASDSSFYRRWQVQDIFSYLKLVHQSNDLDALVRIINKPKRYLFGEEWIDSCWSLARKRNQSILEVLPDLPGLERYQSRYLDKLKQHIFAMKMMSPVDAIQYIREQIGYDRYVETFAKDTGNDLGVLLEPVEELTVAAKQWTDGQAWLSHAEKVNQQLRQSPRTSQVHLMTFHKAKGLEFDRVFLIGLHAMVLPHRRSLQVPENRKQVAWEEERRLLYVGITRAKTELYLSVSKTRQGKRLGASPFLKEIGFEKKVDFPSIQQVSSLSRLSKQSKTQGQPQLRFVDEVVRPGMGMNHVRFGDGVVVKVTPLEGVAPGRKILVRFTDQTITLHYELSRQLKLIALTD